VATRVLVVAAVVVGDDDELPQAVVTSASPARATVAASSVHLLSVAVPRIMGTP